jgi:Tfp pilus assembly protein PilF
MAHLDRAGALRPGNLGVRFQVALVQIAKGEMEAARATLEALVAEEPAFSEAHVSLATVYYRLGRREDGNRQQAIVQQLKREQQAREDAERARKEAAGPP